MNQTTNLLAGAALGAAAMYLLDPDRGRTRRAMIGQRAGRLAREQRDALDASFRDARNRLVGKWHQAASRFHHDDVSDAALVARVRSEMGRHIAHPSAVMVECHDGVVTLSGDVLADEVEALMSCARGVRGVKGVANRLTVHHDAMAVPALQGDGHHQARTNGGLVPGAALAVAAAGVGLAIYGAARRDYAGAAVGAAGVGMAVKGGRDMQGSSRYAKRSTANA
ncbi:MAG TPA: BON domain-containing protein [Fimbriimonadaceae bacterium]|nr:BON domain-containing protein [Fimbriimonadaceae bacterium]